MNKELSANPTFSHYRIVAKLGAGGMGEVWLAEDTRLDRKVAVKLLGEEVSRSDDRLRRFIQEAKAASALNHPNIITVYDIGKAESGAPFIATEYIEGDTLRHLIQSAGLKMRELLDIAVQVASALATAHEAGIIHRDIKPENVMVRPDSLVKVLDFGLAKLTEKQRPATDSEAVTVVKQETDPGLVMGTVQYMSPEQARGKAVDARSDIFSLGIVLYELVTGRAPFKGESNTDVLAAIIDKEPPPLSRYADEVPQELQRIVTKCLRKERDERYQTMRDVLLDLRELRDQLAMEERLERSIRPVSRSGIENQPTLIAEAEITKDQAARPTRGATAPTQSSAEYLVSQVNRHRLGAVLLLALLLAVAAGVGYVAFWAPGRSGQIESIAVMPFVNESGNTEIEYLSDGMTETLIGSLSRLPNLNVKPRSSVFRYKGRDADARVIGKELGVQAVLTGRVIQRGQDVSLFMELIDAGLNKVVWSEQYTRKQSDLVSLQSEIGRDVAAKLKTQLSGAEEAKVAKTYTADPEAYQLYLKGRYHWYKRNADDITKALAHFEAAVKKDPQFALAYSGLADCYLVLPYYSGGKSSEFVERARSYALRAVEIDNQLAEAHASLGYVNQGLWNWAEAEQEYRRALELNPAYSTAQLWYARYEVRVADRPKEGLERLKRALQAEPWSLVMNDNLTQMYLAQGDVQSAFDQGKRVLELEPNTWVGHYYLGYVHVKKGEMTEAQALARKGVERAGRSNRSLVGLGFVLGVAGKKREALEILKELETKYAGGQGDATEVAAVYSGLGNREKMFEWLEKAFQDRSTLLVDLRVEFPFAALHDDPRFKGLLRRMGMPE